MANEAREVDAELATLPAALRLNSLVDPLGALKEVVAIHDPIGAWLAWIRLCYSSGARQYRLCLCFCPYNVGLKCFVLEKMVFKGRLCGFKVFVICKWIMSY